tara:strand:- start:85 stop:897 length:813 start_codon:yes stop_codon:yes gene_type:complete
MMVKNAAVLENKPSATNCASGCVCSPFCDFLSRSYNLPWQPLSADDRAIVQRTSHVISKDELGAKILAALKPELPRSERYSMSFDNRIAEIHLPTNIPPSLSVERVTRDRISNRFFAVLVASEGSHRHTISGKLFRMVEIPVVTRRVRKGDIVDKEDVRTITLRADKLGPDVLMSTEELVGKAPRRTLIEHRPVRASDVRQPLLVKRGGLITMIYQTRFMRISARGKAKQSGAHGDTVRVENSGSKKIVEGVVTGPSEITVTSARPIAMK